MGFLFRKRDEEHDEITTMVSKAQAGNEEVREKLLKDYTPFILRVISSFCNRYIVMGQDDEASIGLLAFNEAIDKYLPDKGAKFLTFAEVVIKRRLTDFYRKESRYTNNVVPLVTSLDAESDEREITNEVVEATKAYQIEQDAADKRQEISQYNQLLANFDITMSELVNISPKHYDARCRAYEVACLIAKNQELVDYLWDKKSLPLKKIENNVSVSRKTLERQRKYIIALVIVLQGNFEHLKSYISDLGKEGT